MTDQSTTTQRTPTSASASTSQNGGSGDKVRDRARDAADTGTHEAGRVVEEAKSQTARLVGETGDRAREHADQQLGRTAGVIEQFGTELDEMASGASQPDGYLAALARDGAQTAHQLSERLENGGLEGVLDDVRRFARRRPGAFLAASFGVGLLLGRVTRNADVDRIKHQMSDQETSDSDGSPSAATGMPMTGGPVTATPTPGAAMPGSPVSNTEVMP